MKTNIVHTLHQVKAFGSQLLESFKEMLTPIEYRKCESNQQLGKTWFNGLNNGRLRFFPLSGQ
jgi:hypothetical protein